MFQAAANVLVAIAVACALASGLALVVGYLVIPAALLGGAVSAGLLSLLLHALSRIVRSLESIEEELSP